MTAGWNKGKKHSEETRRKISEGVKRNHPMRGKHWPEPIKEIIVEALRRWSKNGVHMHRIDCDCMHCSVETRRKATKNRRRRGLIRKKINQSGKKVTIQTQTQNTNS